jgi:hypothetical protein
MGSTLEADRGSCGSPIYSQPLFHLVSRLDAHFDVWIRAKSVQCILQSPQ